MSYVTPPIENTVHIPVPSPCSDTGDSNKENCVRLCCLKGLTSPHHPVGPLVSVVEGIIVDKAKDVEQALEHPILISYQLARMVKNLAEIKKSPSDTGHASDKGDSGSLADYIDSTSEGSPNPDSNQQGDVEFWSIGVSFRMRPKEGDTMLWH
ncbi:hypothetical protein BJ322DRAFT_1021299 [Thelephora terrestris]|uniref:Uncharacterized protein n=1 Tax=Thelephora terrestris TaxID=56493 RepID=A0A9P6HDH9_9AGAM|nr:hypothetical protein BJ322DRAFT_1021299 [Thelephora terrestris]